MKNIEMISTAALQPYERNSRTHSELQIKQIAASINEFGFINPVLIDQDKRIIAGHGRVQAAKVLGMDAVPCLYVDGLSESQIRAYVIADNKLAENAGWDDAILRAELLDLKSLDFNLDLIGFAEDDLADLLADLGTDGLTAPDDIPELPKDPVSQPGDVWTLGNHRLMCGDSTSAADVSRMLAGGGAASYGH